VHARVAAPDLQPWNARSINQELLRSGLQAGKWLPAYAFFLDGAGEGPGDSADVSNPPPEAAPLTDDEHDLEILSYDWLK